MKRIGTSIMFVAITLLSQAQTVYNLEDCRRLATTHNKDILIASENVKAAKNLQKAARTQYLPNFSANGTYFWNEKNVSLLGEDKYLPVYNTNANGTTNFATSVNNKFTLVNGSPVPLDASGTPFDPTKNPEKILWKSYAYIPKDQFEFDTHNVFAGTIMMTQPIFMGGKIRELNKIAKYTKKIAEIKLEGETSDVLLQTDEDYWRVVSLVNKEKLAKSYVALLQKMDSDLEKSIAFGVATKSDGLSVKVKLNEAEMSLLQVQDGLSLSKMALAQICGLPLESDFTLADENIQPQEPIAKPVVDVTGAIEKRYEVQGLKQSINIAESNRRIMLSRFMPNAGLTAGYLVSNPNMYNGYSKEFAGMWQVGVVLNVPIFHFGEKLYTLKAAQIEKKIAQYKLDDAREKIQLDITQASFKISEAAKKAKMTKYNKDKAQENLKYATIGFESGVISPSVLMEAQTAWLKANSEEIDASINVKLCDVYLQKAMGELK
jgi:outer membrane protein TolC